jgi:hypothetical protein
MTAIVPLLEQAMEDTAAALVLADLLEERGEERRAAVVRRLMDYQKDSARRDVWLAEAEEDGYRWMGPRVGPIMAEMPVLIAGAWAFPLIVAELAEVEEGPLKAGTAWRGILYQNSFQVPTTMRLRSREGNLISGVLEEDFSRMYRGLGYYGTFHFSGAAVGRVMTVQVSRVEGHGIKGGLYTLQLQGGGWLSGRWWVPTTFSFDGDLRLRRVAEVAEGAAS